jgi:hypothetical protein
VAVEVTLVVRFDKVPPDQDDATFEDDMRLYFEAAFDAELIEYTEEEV